MSALDIVNLSLEDNCVFEGALQQIWLIHNLLLNKGNLATDIYLTYLNDIKYNKTFLNLTFERIHSCKNAALAALGLLLWSV